MSMYSEALALATVAHAGQKDKAGEAYINHPVAVASFVEGEDEKVAALLHDVIEDTWVTEEYLRPRFGDVVTDAVVAMTHLEDEPYLDYIERVKRNPLAKTVKMADLKHNMDLNRFSVITEKEIERVVSKYVPALMILAA